MEYVEPFGVTTPNAPYVGRNTPGATSGSKVPPEAIEHPMREIVAAIVAAGLTPDGEDLTQLAQAISLFGIKHGTTVYNTAGTHTFIAPHTGWYLVEVYGGGGGGCLNSTGGHGEGGGGGGYSEKWVYLEEGAEVVVTVGDQGSTRADGVNNAAAGGTSSFGAYCSATGGGGGNISGAPGVGGTGSGGDINLTGQSGVNGITAAPAGLGGSAAGPHGGHGAFSATAATWPGGGGAVAGDGTSSTFSAGPAVGGVIIKY